MLHKVNSLLQIQISTLILQAPMAKSCLALMHAWCWLCQYGLWSFQVGGTKLERFLHRNQHTQRKLLNFDLWINGELSKIGHHFSNKVI